MPKQLTPEEIALIGNSLTALKDLAMIEFTPRFDLGPAPKLVEQRAEEREARNKTQDAKRLSVSSKV